MCCVLISTAHLRLPLLTTTSGAPQCNFDGFLFHSIIHRIHSEKLASITKAATPVMSALPQDFNRVVLSSNNPYKTEQSNALLSMLKSTSTVINDKGDGISIVEATSVLLGKDALPIDAYKEEIIRRVERDRVVIIHGETGCVSY